MKQTDTMPPVSVVGAGLAGCEAAWTLANAGVPVSLYEMKPQQYTPAHHYQGFAELICSNSLKAARIGSAAGMLKEEMRILGSLTMEAAAHTDVSAGGGPGALLRLHHREDFGPPADSGDSPAGG